MMRANFNPAVIPWNFFPQMTRMNADKLLKPVILSEAKNPVVRRKTGFFASLRMTRRGILFFIRVHPRNPRLKLFASVRVIRGHPSPSHA